MGQMVLYKYKLQAGAVGATACIYKGNRQNEKSDAHHAVKQTIAKNYFFKKLVSCESKKIDRRERLKLNFIESKFYSPFIKIG